MKHLCGCFESKSFPWSVIQPVLNHFNFLAGKWSGKVCRALKLFINMCIRCKLFDVVKGQRLDPGSHRSEFVHNGQADQLRCFVGYVGYDAIPALALDHRHNSTFVVGTYHVIAFPMTRLFPRFNLQGPFT